MFDLRKSTLSATLPGHADTVTGLALSPDGNHLLSNSMDNTLRAWDMRPYAPEDRCVKVRCCRAETARQAWLTGGCTLTMTMSDRVCVLIGVLACGVSIARLLDVQHVLGTVACCAALCSSLARHC